MGTGRKFRASLVRGGPQTRSSGIAWELARMRTQNSTEAESAVYLIRSPRVSYAH